MDEDVTDLPRLAAEWREQAIRLHERYVREVVEACRLCPWADPSRARRGVREAVLLHSESAHAPSLAVLAAWADDPQVEVGFLLFPRLALRARAFDAFTADLGEREARRHDVGGAPFVLAAFHPEAEPDTSDAERFIPFLRRTPDPCIQVLRAAALDRARAGTPQGTQFVDVAALMTIETAQAAETRPLRERIARANLETAQRMGVGALRDRLDAIRHDREATYAALVDREASLDATRAE
jgi:hypothetical protein